MIELADFLATAGRESVAAFWFPAAIWTLFALSLSSFLWANDSLPSAYQLHSRTALLMVLPLGILGSAFVRFWATLSGSAMSGSLKFIVVQNPITVTAASPGAAVINWLDPFLWVGVLLVLLALGSLTGILYLGWNLYRLHKFSASLDFKPLTSMFDDVTASARHQPGIAFCDEVQIPFTFGWFRTRIVLPESLRNQDQKLKLSVRHELTHIKHRDFLMNNLLAFIRCLFWFHPLTHMLHNQCKEYREILCDSEVLSDLTVSKKGYAELLYELATRQKGDHQLAVSMAVNPSTLKKRIKMMNNQPGKSYKKSIFLVVFSALFMTGIISCSDLQQNGITNQEVVQMQSQIDVKPAKNHPLFVINGEVYHSPETISRIKTKYIKSITVLKGEKAKAKYGKAGANGVVEIILNAKEKALSDLMKNPPPPPTPGESGGVISSHPGEPPAPFFVAVEEMPELIGGLRGLTQKINYPEKARKAGVEGRVIIQFIVNEQGNVENPQIIRGVSESLDQEALRVVKQAQFTPGMQRGEPVRVQYSLPITFKLSEK